MTCLTCPADLTVEGHPVPFPPSIDINYFQLKFLQNLLFIPQNSIPNFIPIFQNSKYCSSCASDLLEVTQTLRKIDILQEKVAAFKESFQDKLVQGFQKESLSHEEFYPAPDEIGSQNFKKMLLKGLNLLQDDGPGIDSLPIFKSEPVDDIDPYELLDLVNNEFPIESSSPSPSYDLKELTIPLSRLNLPPGQTTINLKDDQFNRLNLPTRCPYYPQCGFQTRAKHGLECHLNRFHMNKPEFKCSECGITKRYKSEMIAHQKSKHHGIKALCPICHQGLSTKAALRKHLAWHKKQDLSNSQTLNPQSTFEESDFVRCTYFPQCQYKTRAKGGLNCHLNRFHKGKEWLSCSYCGIKKRFKSEMAAHERIKHPGIKPAPKESPEPSENPQIFPCTECTFVGNSRRKLSCHMSSVHKDKKFQCSFCGLEKRYKYQIEDHERIQHQGIRSFTCPVCNGSFATKATLLVHVKKHAKSGQEIKSDNMRHSGGSKPICEICGMSFLKGIYLKGHIRRVHQNEGKDWMCEHCGKVLCSKIAHADHIARMHTGGKCLKCSECTKTYTKRIELENHIKAEHQGLKFTCEICSKTLSWRSSYQKHMRSHSGKIWRCPICDRGFGTVERMRGHQENHNKE